ncbi:MAG: hypothetical protein LBV70_03300 [Candidatus Adiutrix sp.]|jgi:hypothetical protein|nr:hypothetical protein [Candidatus Adiutrix sp.]
MAAFSQPSTAKSEDQLNFLRLKERFETLAQRYSDPIILTCLAVETTAQAWTLAAARLTEDPDNQTKWLTQAAEFEKSWGVSRDWDARHRRALKVYYEALSEVARKLAGFYPNGRQNAELAVVLDRNDRAMAALTKNPDDYLEKETFSYGLMNLADVLIRSSDLGLDQPADFILDSVIKETRALRRQKGLHYRARLAFIYAAQIQGLTDLLFLLGQAAGPPLSRPLTEIRIALDKDGADSRLPTTLGLIWTAQAQASLPLAYWLSTRPSAYKGGRP